MRDPEDEREVREDRREEMRPLLQQLIRIGPTIFLGWMYPGLQRVGPWRRFAEGCHCNRATLELIRACGLELKDVQETSWRAMPPIVRPLITGAATKSEI